MMENSYSKFHAHTRRTTKYGGPPPPCEGIFPRDYTIVSRHLWALSRPILLTSWPLIKYQSPLPSSLEAPQRHTARRWETLERHRGGRTDSRRGAANLPFSTPPRGTGTSPRSSRSATLIPRRQFSRSPFPDTVSFLPCSPFLNLRFLLLLSCGGLFSWFRICRASSLLRHREFGSYYPLARPANRKALTPLHYAVQGSHLELIEYLVRKGASVTAMTKAGQTPIDRVSTDEVRALLVECKQPLTKDDKSTTIMEVGDSVSKEHIKENNGGSVAEEAANVDEEGVDTKEKRREWYGRMESRRIMFSFDVVGPSKCMFRRYGSMVSSSQSDAEVTAKLDGHEGVDVVPSQESSSGHISSSLLLWSTVSVVILLLSVCRSADSESKPEGRQARKQRKKEAIRARLIVPQPQAVMSLEQTVSEKCLLERRDAIRSKCRGNCRSSSR
ncbi:Ankyrin repeat [Musa troglodytarum]|uniref:Ankyrin repeat n=1 Tax=Musa troglodytarum TaxID=320322 RepID=A0A9E7ELD8_9LILI|nr:Ankyrin repeat [Musa troglodytarum]